MEEQSHKDEMRAALRGDFERMRQRQAGEGEPAHPAPPPSPPPAVTTKQPHVVLQDGPAGSWLDRLLGRT